MIFYDKYAHYPIFPGAKGKKASKRTPLRHLRPTYTHEAIVKLLEMGMFKYIISQNTDGLHRLSGVPADKISELHGNAFVEKCEDCEKRYDVTVSYRDSPPVKAFPLNPCERCRIYILTAIVVWVVHNRVIITSNQGIHTV